MGNNTLNQQSFFQPSNIARKELRTFVFSCVFVLGCSVGFAQSIAVDPVAEISHSKSDAVYSDSNEHQVELVLWLMGSKQVSPIDSHGEQLRTIGKKQFINLGILPNRILSNSFMKKAVNYQSTIA